MKCKIVGWSRIKPKNSNDECYILHTLFDGEKGFNGMKTKVFLQILVRLRVSNVSNFPLMQN